LGAIVFETYAFYKARAELKRQIDTHDWSGYREAFRKTSDVTTLTAFTEDFVALAGAGIALFGIYLSRVTDNPVFDAVSALVIGLMLMGFAIALAWENKRLLLGESMPHEDERELRNVVAGWNGVDELVGFRTVYFGPGEVLVATEVAFADDLTADVRPDVIDDIEAAIREAEPHANRIYVEPVD
jgi:divalent metal cation (Fe/Co/Zn/Cd) transporter